MRFQIWVLLGELTSDLLKENLEDNPFQFGDGRKRARPNIEGSGSDSNDKNHGEDDMALQISATSRKHTSRAP